MADEKDEDLEIVEVDELPDAPKQAPAIDDDADEEDSPQGAPEDYEADEEDDKLVAAEDDEDDPEPKKKPRVSSAERKRKQKEARDRTLREVDELRAFKARVEPLLTSLEPRLAAIEGNTLSVNEGMIDERISKVRQDVSDAERIMQRAMAAGEGEDFTTAMRLRDEAKDAERVLLNAKDTFSKAREAKPVVDSRVTQLAASWKNANSGWYDIDAEMTRVAKGVDAQVASEGYDPNTPAYWNELTRRMNARAKPEEKANGKGDGPVKKRVPPQGAARDQRAGSAGAGKVYLTPDRIQAIKDAGAWDDAAERQKMARAYAKWDSEQAAS